MHLYTWLCSAAGRDSYWCRAFAPENLADWTSAVLTGLGLLGLIVGAIVAKRTLDEMRLQTQTLKDQFAWTDRAWLKVTATAPEPMQYRGGADSRDRIFHLPIEVQIENVGRSVAVDVDAVVELEYIPPTVSSVDRMRERLDILAATMRTRPKGEGATLFPGGPVTLRRTVSVSEFQLTDVYSSEQRRLKMPDRATVSFMVIGCCGYRLSVDARPRISTFAYLLMHRPVADAKPTSKFVIDELNSIEDVNELVGLHEAFRAD